MSDENGGARPDAGPRLAPHEVSADCVPVRNTVSRPRSSLSHRGRRCARPARRDDEVVSWGYVEEEQRRRAGYSGGRMPTNFWVGTLEDPFSEQALGEFGREDARHVLRVEDRIHFDEVDRDDLRAI